MDALAMLREDHEALRRRVEQLSTLVDRQEPEPEARISTGIAAAIYGCDKTWMRKLIVRRKLGRLEGRRWRIDPHAFTAFVAATRPERMPELRRWLAGASKRV